MANKARGALTGRAMPITLVPMVVALDPFPLCSNMEHGWPRPDKMAAFSASPVNSARSLHWPLLSLSHRPVIYDDFLPWLNFAKLIPRRSRRGRGERLRASMESLPTRTVWIIVILGLDKCALEI